MNLIRKFLSWLTWYRYNHRKKNRVNETFPIIIKNHDFKRITDLIEPELPANVLVPGSIQFVNREGNDMIIRPSGWTMEYIYHDKKDSKKENTETNSQ